MSQGSQTVESVTRRLRGITGHLSARDRTIVLEGVEAILELARVGHEHRHPPSGAPRPPAVVDEGGFLEEMRHQLEDQDVPRFLLTMADVLAYVKESLTLIMQRRGAAPSSRRGLGPIRILDTGERP